MADTDEWVSLATDLLEREKEEAELIILSQKTSEADACRSSASEEGDNFAESGSVADEYVASDVPLEPCAADSFWVQLLKSSTKHCKPGGVSSSTSVGVLSACTGCFAEGFAFKAWSGTVVGGSSLSDD